MDVQNLIKIRQLIQKILNINKILMLIKNYNCVENKPKIRCNNPNLDLININAYTKCYEKSGKILKKNTSFISIKGNDFVVYERN